MGPELIETEPNAAPDEGASALAPPPAPEAPAAPEAPPAPAGEPAFRVVGLQCEWLADPHPEGLEGAIAAELGLRVQRLAQSVDSALLLTDEGVVRFLGEPVARLTRGEETLNPKVLVLADSRLSEGERNTAQARVEAWIVAQFRKTLGPLLELYGLDSDKPDVKTVAERVVKGLGIVERSKLQREVRGLDQPSRAVLREKGLRFGSYYVFLPALLKPAARKLAATLWERTSGVAMFEGPRAALALGASAGRTSLAVEPGISPADCQMFGYRLCGDRAVRIDIVERLADLIRAQLAAAKAPAGAAPRPYGFAVLPQMTSMSGCSHEQFASVLRSLGYESFEAMVEPEKPGEAAEVHASHEEAPHEDAPEPEAHPEIAAEALAETEPVAEAQAEPAAEALAEADAAAGPIAESTPEMAPAAPSPDAKPVELWRLAPRQAHTHQPRPQRREPAKGHTPREWTIPARPAPVERPQPEPRPEAVAVEGAPPAPRAERPRFDKPRFDKRPPRPARESHAEYASTAKPRSDGPVDKDSPFYKLMALREQLAKK